MLKKINSENFEYAIQSENGPYIIKFGSQSCGPCHTMKPVLDTLAQNNPSVSVYEVDTDESPELAGHFEIRSVPTMHYCEGREILFSQYGVTPLRDMQYVIDNFNDEYFRANGEFQIEKTKKNYTFEILIGVVLLGVVLAFSFASLT